MNKAKPQSLRDDIIGGLTNFFTTAYIIIVNPQILADPATGMPYEGVATATVLLCAGCTLLMGLYAKLPYVVAPGMGINAFVAFTLIVSKGVPWQVAMGLTFWAGVLFLIASLTPIREVVAKSIPRHLRIAISAGVGMFLAFIGLRNTGLIVADQATFVRMGGFTTELVLSLGGLALIGLWWTQRKPWAFLAGIAAVTVAGWTIGAVEPPSSWVGLPDFSSTLLQLDIFGALSLALVPTLIALFFTDLFDSLSTFVGVSTATDLVDDEGRPLRMKQGLTVDAFATWLAGLLGTSSGTAYLESAAGISAGGRSGRAAVVTGLCFLPCLFLAPALSAVPAFATAPVLVVVGAMMFKTLTTLRVEHFEEVFPAFLVVVLMPLTFSITVGILWGFIAHCVLFLCAGRGKEVSVFTYGLGALSLGLLWLEHG